MQFFKNRRILILALVIGSFALGAFTSRQLLRSITSDDVRKASNIMGLEFTQTEIDSLLPGLEEYRQDYEANRQIEVSNDIPLPLYFNPLPPGYQLETFQRPVSFRNIGPVEMPADTMNLLRLSIRELGTLLRDKKITSVQLTELYLNRLKQLDPYLHCVVTLTEERAMEQARQADKEFAAGRYRGMLQGIPYGIKDLFATKGYKTTWGAEPFKDQVLDYDATVVQKLEDAGAVLVAKLATGSLAWGDVWYGGQTRNPWNLEEGSSGSSAGPAAAVAAGLVPFAIGTETLGSIVSPSTVCGTTGLRPTFGRVSRHGAMALSWSMDKIGPICRSVEDAAIVFDAIRGPDGKDQSVIEAPFNYTASLNPRLMKVGYLKSAFEQDYPFKSQDSLLLAKMKQAGFELIPIELPDYPDIGFILEAEAAAAFDELTRSGKDDQLVRQIRNAWPNVFRQARFIPAVEYIQANRIRTQLMMKMEELFKEVDAYIHPSWASPSLRITNFTGHPCVVVPSGVKDGKPTSISVTGPLFKEDHALVVAHELQKLSPLSANFIVGVGTKEESAQPKQPKRRN